MDILKKKIPEMARIFVLSHCLEIGGVDV